MRFLTSNENAGGHLLASTFKNEITNLEIGTDRAASPTTRWATSLLALLDFLEVDIWSESRPSIAIYVQTVDGQSFAAMRKCDVVHAWTTKRRTLPR